LVKLRRLCGDPGPVLVGERDVVSIALARVVAVPDDAASWLWLVRLTTQWNAKSADCCTSGTLALTRASSAATLSSHIARRIVNQQRFWEAMWESQVGAALPAPPRSALDDDDGARLLPAAVSVHVCRLDCRAFSKVALAFVRAAKAILHPLDTT
jgi:hypothetical protein